ncbi:MAG: prolyl oligopeptidase family serine peptidase, partial [Acidobacteriota bacterium]|nr:prolyl oligopeptidase family serine peptidase [Acidobacteriota bacterium]
GWAKRLYTKDNFGELSESPKLELRKIKYSSDGQKVVGFIYKPKVTEGKKLPVIIWNRGGIGEETKISNQNFHDIYEMYRLANAGFVVLASQYRGIDGGEGTDEVGGADINDIMNLLPLAKSLPYADTENMYIWGVSRGAMMALQAVRDGLPVKAAVVVGVPSDWNEMLISSPNLVDSIKRIWRDFDTRREEHIKTRSAILWADKLNVPLLILNGADDPVTPPKMALDFAKKLEEQGKFYELTIYAKNDHFVDQSREDRLKRTIEWFQNPRKKSIAQTLLKTIRAQNADAAVKQYQELKKTQPNLYDWSENELNQLGYILINNRRLKEAVEIFKLNVEAHPNSANAFDSLGEVYAIIGERDLAIKNYRRSLDLNPQNTGAVEALKKLEGQTNKVN